MTRTVQDRQEFDSATQFELESAGADVVRVVTGSAVTVTVEAYRRDAGDWVQFYSQSAQDHEIDPVGRKLRVDVGSASGLAVAYAEKDRQ